MSIWYRINGSQISPCIIAQVKFKLGITTKSPKNTKSCSDTYWNEVLSIVAIKFKKDYKKLLR